MGMTINEAIGVSETCQYILSNQVGSNWCKSKYDAVTIAINTMRKYQKIKEQVDIAIDKENFAISDARLIQIREIINGKID